MTAIWTDEARMSAWLEVELAVCEAWAQLGEIPMDAVKDIRSKACFNVNRVNEIEETTHHDVIAFISCLAENVGDSSKYIHYGLTSSDVLDTGLALQLRAAGALLEEEAKLAYIQRRARERDGRDRTDSRCMPGQSPLGWSWVSGPSRSAGGNGCSRPFSGVGLNDLRGCGVSCRSAGRADCHVYPGSGVPHLYANHQRDRRAVHVGPPYWRYSGRSTLVRHYQRAEVLEAEMQAKGFFDIIPEPHNFRAYLRAQALVIRSNLLAALRT
jgi:hypothetical protein